MASGVSSTFGGTQLGERAVSNHAKNSLAGSEIHKHFKQLKDRHTKSIKIRTVMKNWLNFCKCNSKRFFRFLLKWWDWFECLNFLVTHRKHKNNGSLTSLLTVGKFLVPLKELPVSTSLFQEPSLNRVNPETSLLTHILTFRHRGSRVADIDPAEHLCLLVCYSTKRAFWVGITVLFIC